MSQTVVSAEHGGMPHDPASGRAAVLVGADLALAVLAGPASWDDAQAGPTGLQRGVATLSALALAIAVWVPVLLGPPGNLGAPAWVALTVTAAVLAVLLVAPTLRWAWAGLPDRFGRAAPHRVAAVRAGGAVAFGAVWVVLVGDYVVVAAWPLGVATGSEAFLSAAAIGAPVDPLGWWRRFCVSGLHLGIAAGLLVALLLTRSAEPVLLYLALHVGVATAVATVAVLCGVAAARTREQARRDVSLLAREHRRRAHWLHDDVTSELRLLRLKLEAGAVPEHLVVAELDQLDHRLRLRQLDELLQSGAVRLAELIQPYVRLAQGQGVEVVETPRYDDASLTVDEPTGRLLQRVLAVLVMNALQAGTRTLAIRAHHGGDPLVVTVEVQDDAGGFPPGPLPAGRGLDSLRRDLGPGRLDVEPCDRGSLVRAVLVVDAAALRRRP